ncbi:MAG: glycine--tRNA ligase subunit beta [Candidatus Aminicenantes bacterium]|nr:MAG: glycine--tRNA ligase subunit beta [Candidatus Aminicenantes bacterium]
MDFLLEITTEEMPPSHIKTALVQLRESLVAELLAQKVDAGEIRAYGTCRRMIIAGNLAVRQKDSEEEIIGPPKAAAFTQNGSPTPAARGFAKSKGVEIRSLEVIKTNRGEYLGIRKVEKGSPTKDLLKDIIPRIVSFLSFPKMMRWGKNSFRFSRPIKNILCLFDGKALPFSIAGVASRNITTGHKIYFPQRVKVRSFPDYRKALKNKKVIIDPEERKSMILNHIERKISPKNAELHPDDELLESLIYDVEHPYVFLGSFPEEYLDLPLEILSTAMREGQKLFSVVRGKRQLPYFLGVADAYRDSKSLIRKGNERVLKARLEDARFFWKQDLKISLKSRSKLLNRVVFQEKLGSYEDKIQRLKKITAYIADKIDAVKEKKHAIAAAELSKIDLLTEMVREFPSLQGKVGGLYAREEGNPAPIWQAVYEHYQPVSLDDESPSSVAGAMLSIADKLDSVVGVVGIGIKVSGSKDPFGLRRLAQGACKVILEKKLSFSFPRLLDKVMNVFGDKLHEPRDLLKKYCQNFFSERLRYIFERQGYQYDLVDAALGAGIDDVYYSFLRLKALHSLKESAQFEAAVLTAKRVNNILRDQPLYKINPELLKEKEERELYTTLCIIRDNVLPLIAKGDFTKAQRIIFRIRPILNDFFDNILVMVEETRIRRNRLALLQEISKLLIQVADYSRIVIEG